MKLAVALMFLIAIASVAASTFESQYLVVLGEKAPASDAVIGANFAASMKASVGVTFSSALDTQLYETITEEELGSKTLVIIDGESRKVRILGASNAAAAASTYFTRQGFEVEEERSPEREDVLLHPPKQEVRQEALDVPQVPKALPDAMAEVGVPVIEPSSEPDPVATVQVDSNADVETAAEPSVLKRVWRWFASWF